jgi:hypothetical protein
MDRKTIIILFFALVGCMQADDPTKAKMDECEALCEFKNKNSPNKNEFSDYEICLVSCDSQKIYIYIRDEHEKETK